MTSKLAVLSIFVILFVANGCTRAKYREYEHLAVRTVQISGATFNVTTVNNVFFHTNVRNVSIVIDSSLDGTYADAKKVHIGISPGLISIRQADSIIIKVTSEAQKQAWEARLVEVIDHFYKPRDVVPQLH